MPSLCFESLLADVRTAIPGPKSQAWAARLRRVESPDTTYLGDDFPVFWERASGSNVWDADGNRYIDLTGAFGVAGPGHTHPNVVEAIRAQCTQLVHGMGDVHPAALKVRVGEALAAIAPGDLGVSIFGSSGSEAVEAALKTAAIAAGKPGVLAFEGAYHGLGYGALAVTHRSDFRLPFVAQLNPYVHFAPFPHEHHTPHHEVDAASAASRSLEAVDAWLRSPSGAPCGAVIVEPIQGRAGIRVPHPSFMRGLREICTRRAVLLIVDEILTGLGRTGSWFECAKQDVVPELLCVGKVLGGGLPLSACIGRREVMQAWGASTGEARHTSTFLGNPLACAAGLAMLDVLRSEDWPGQVAARAPQLEDRFAAFSGQPGVSAVRGMGFLWGVELVNAAGEPDGRRAFEIVRRALREGVLLLADGADRNVLAFMPPYSIADEQLDAALAVVHHALEATAP